MNYSPAAFYCVESSTACNYNHDCLFQLSAEALRVDSRIDTVYGQTAPPQGHTLVTADLQMHQTESNAGAACELK